MTTKPRRWMRRLSITALAAAVALTGAVIAAPPSPAASSASRVMFRDSFSNTPDPAWTVINRAGAVRDGRLWIDGSYVARPTSRDGWAFTHIGDTAWRDYTVDLTVDQANVGGSPPEAHMSTVYLRVMKRGATGRDIAYRIDLWAPGQPDPTTRSHYNLKHGLVQMSRYVGGTLTNLAIVRNANLCVGGPNHVRIAAIGSTITLTDNGVEVASYQDPHPIEAGGIGVGQIWETNGWYDNLVVRPLG